MNIKDLVKDKRVKFSHYKEKELWYLVDGTDFKFPVSIYDVGDATFLAEDKALLFMRWIRKHLENIQDAKEKEEQVDLP